MYIRALYRSLYIYMYRIDDERGERVSALLQPRRNSQVNVHIIYSESAAHKTVVCVNIVFFFFLHHTHLTLCTQVKCANKIYMQNIQTM